MTALAVFVIGLGVWLLASALANWEWYLALAEFTVAEGLLGEDAARWLCGLCGLALIALGVVWLLQ